STVQGNLSDGALSLNVNDAAFGVATSPDQPATLKVVYRTNVGERTIYQRRGYALNLPNAPWDTGLVDLDFRPEPSWKSSIISAVELRDRSLAVLGIDSPVGPL